jgi:type I restriction enzyme, S subunit
MILRFYKQVLIDKAPEAARANINLAILNKLNIIQPPINEQEKYSQISNLIEQKKGVLLESKSQIEEFFDSVLQRAFSGKLSLNVSIEVEALLNEIDIHKTDNDLFSIITNEEYLLSLVHRLNNQEFESQDLYDKAKHGVFQLLKAEERLAQEYDEHSQSLKLVVK